MQQIGFFIAKLIVCSTCFGHHYAHHQELNDCLSLTYVTNKRKKNLHYTINTTLKEEKHKEKPFKANIKVPIISSSHKKSNREERKSVSRHFCPGLPVSLTFCPVRQRSILS
jgi:hypothetical protein